MILWSLLLPFKWFIIGVSEVFVGIFNLLKMIASLLGSLCKCLFKGIIAVSRGIFFVIENIIRYLFMIIKWTAKKVASLILLFFRGLAALFRGLFIAVRTLILWIAKAIKGAFVYTFLGVKAILSLIVKALKNIFVYAYKALYFIFKYLYLGVKAILSLIVKALKNIFVYAYKALYFLFGHLYLGIKAVFFYLYLAIKTIIIYVSKSLFIVCKYIYLVIKTIIIYIYKILKYIIVSVLYTYPKALISFIINGIIFIFNKIRIIIVSIAKAIVFPFVYLYKNFGRIVIDYTKKIKNQIKKGAIAFVSIPGRIKAGIVNRYNNLSIIKDLRNRREMKRQALLIDFDAEDSVRSEKKIIYRYTARSSEGKIEKGTLGAYSKLDVHSYLMAEGYEVYEIKPTKRVSFSYGGIHRMKMSEMVFFLTQLATYIKSGIPLVDSIKILGKQTRNRKTSSLYKSIIYDLTMGDSLSEALDKQGNALPKLLINMVKSSEMAGNLSETLDDMAEYYNSVSQTRKQMKSAMTYPTVILVFAVSVVVFILTFVIPSFIQMYKDADAEVPALTTAIINLSDFLINNSIWLVIGVVGGIFGLYYLYKNVKIFKLLVQWMMMHMPIIGKIIIYNEVTMFSKTFASLWNHNVFITNSMEILSKITDNEIYKMLIFDAITNVARGETVSSSFKNNWAFPVVAYEMLVTGERTGQPGPMMDKVASYYQEEHRNAINQVKAFIEPALIIVLAAVVGTILLAVVIPMFNIYSQIGLE